jgi:hypothetical protein
MVYAGTWQRLIDCDGDGDLIEVTQHKGTERIANK